VQCACGKNKREISDGDLGKRVEERGLLLCSALVPRVNCQLNFECLYNPGMIIFSNLWNTDAWPLETQKSEQRVGATIPQLGRWYIQVKDRRRFFGLAFVAF